MKATYKETLDQMSQQYPFSSTATLVYEILLDEIICGNLSSGTAIKQNELSEQFELSRTPVREAIIKLMKDGYIEKAAKGGLRVYVFHSRDYTELLEFRIQLEALALRRVSLYSKEDMNILLQHSLEKLKIASDTNNIKAALEADHEFHLTIINACHNQYVINSYLQHVKKIQFFRNILAEKQNWSSTYRHHEKILKSIVERNAEAAVRYLKLHLNISKELALLVF